jgi:hypothetical protein
MTPEDFDVSEEDARKQFENFLLEYPKMYSAQESHSRFQTFWENLKVNHSRVRKSHFHSENQISQPHRARQRQLRNHRIRRFVRLRIPPPLPRPQTRAQESEPKKVRTKIPKFFQKAEIREIC